MVRFNVFGLTIFLIVGFPFLAYNSPLNCSNLFGYSESKITLLNKKSDEIQKTYSENLKNNLRDRSVEKLFQMLYLRQPLGAQFSGSRSKEIEFSTDILDRISVEQILRLATSYALCEKVAQHPAGFRVFAPFHKGPSPFLDHPPINAKTLYHRARILALVHLLNQAEAEGHQTLSPKLFFRIAELENLQIEVFPLSYRFDSRTPEEIIRSGGFFSNKRLGTVYEHSAINSQGVAFVSLSATEGNYHNLSIASVRENAVKSDLSKLSDQEIVMVRQHAFKGKPAVLETYEYRVENLGAVRPHVKSRIKEEDELVAPDVPIEQISFYRKVIFVLDDRGPYENHDVVFVHNEPWVARTTK